MNVNLLKSLFVAALSWEIKRLLITQKANPRLINGVAHRFRSVELQLPSHKGILRKIQLAAWFRRTSAVHLLWKLAHGANKLSATFAGTPEAALFSAPPVFRWTDGKWTCRCEVDLLVSKGGGAGLLSWCSQGGLTPGAEESFFRHLKYQQVTSFPFLNWTFSLWLNPALKIDYIRFVVVTERHCLLVLSCRIGLWRHDVTRLGLLPARNNLSSHLSRGRKTKLNSCFSFVYSRLPVQVDQTENMLLFQARWWSLFTSLFSSSDGPNSALRPQKLEQEKCYNLHH